MYIYIYIYIACYIVSYHIVLEEVQAPPRDADHAVVGHAEAVPGHHELEVHHLQGREGGGVPEDALVHISIETYDDEYDFHHRRRRRHHHHHHHYDHCYYCYDVY